MRNEVKIYVHGSCHFLGRQETDEPSGNGGYGVVININGNREEALSEGYANTTNSRMDLMGIIDGLEEILEPSNITVYLSNGYIIDALTKGWLENWKKNGFKKRKHVDLWQKLDKVLSQNRHIILFKHSKEVQYSPDFQLAERLSKTSSAKPHQPMDLRGEDNVSGLFGLPKIPKPVQQNIAVLDDKPILDSVCVDASTLGNPGPTEYQGVDTKTKQVLFSMKYEEATNNIGEFLAIVHALALYKRDGKELKIIYSDSLNAISWVKQKKCKTKFEKTEKTAQLFDHIQRAVAWLENNAYDTKILKWQTTVWGQIPADYGRK